MTEQVEKVELENLTGQSDEWWSTFVESCIAQWSTPGIQDGVQGRSHSVFWLAVVVSEVSGRLRDKGDGNIAHALAVSLVLKAWAQDCLHRKASSGRYPQEDAEYMAAVARGLG